MHQLSPWAIALLVELFIFTVEVLLMLLDIPDKFWLAVVFLVLFLCVGVLLLRHYLKTRLWVLFSVSFVVGVGCFLYRPLKKQDEKEHAVEALVSWFHRIDARVIWFAFGILVALIGSGVAQALRSRWRRKQREDQDVAALHNDTPPAQDEIADDQVVPALLERLPWNQKQLLIELDLGEKVYPLDEPGLEYLERNRLALRLRQVTDNTYLFRVHPDNAARVHTFYEATVISPLPSKAPNASGDAVAALQVAYQPCRIVMRFVCDHFNSLFRTVLVINLPGCRTLIAQLLRPAISDCEKVLDALETVESLKGECSAAQFADLKKLFVQALSRYTVLGRYLLEASPEFIAEDFFPRERQCYAQWQVQHAEAYEAIKKLRIRHEFADDIPSSILADLDQLSKAIAVESVGAEEINRVYSSDGSLCVVYVRALRAGRLSLVVAVNAPIVTLRYLYGGLSASWHELAVNDRDRKLPIPTFRAETGELVTVEAQGQLPENFNLKIEGTFT
jgi:hypothetical protein